MGGLSISFDSTLGYLGFFWYFWVFGIFLVLLGTLDTLGKKKSLSKYILSAPFDQVSPDILSVQQLSFLFFMFLLCNFLLFHIFPFFFFTILHGAVFRVFLFYYQLFCLKNVAILRFHFNLLIKSKFIPFNNISCFPCLTICLD